MDTYEESSNSSESESDYSENSTTSNESDEDSDNFVEQINEGTWFFESYDHHTNSSNIDSYVFWSTQIGASIFWCIFAFLKIISLSLFWGMLVFVAAYLSLTNLYAYYKCLKDHEAKLTSVLISYGGGIVNMETLVEGVQAAKKLGKKVRKNRRTKI